MAPHEVAELRSYSRVIKLEQDRPVYQAGLDSRYGRAWRRTAPIEALMPLRLARYGIPLAQTAPADLATVGIDGFMDDGFPKTVALPHCVLGRDSPTTAVGELPAGEDVQATASTRPD